MIDGFKCTIHGVNPDLLRHKLEFRTGVNDNTGEADPYSKAQLDNLFLVMNNERKTCSIRGSLHKYAHNGRNDTDFGHSDLKGCIDGLVGFFECEPENFILHNLEFGVNLDYPPADIIENLLQFGPSQFAPMSANARQSRGVSCELARYEFKLYGKTKMLFRLETKASKMEYLRPIFYDKLLTFEHLADHDILRGLGGMLLKTWDKVMLREELDFTGLKPIEREVLTLGQYPSFWVD